MGVAMLLIKLFLLAFSLPHEAITAFHKVDWQSYLPPPVPMMQAQAAPLVATNASPTAPSPAAQPMLTINVPAGGFVTMPQAPAPLPVVPPAPPPRVQPNPKLDKDMVYKSLFGTSEEVAALIEKGGRVEAVNEKGESTLAIAAKRVNADGILVVKALLAGGADVDQRDRNGEIPLFHAARAGNIETVKLLLDAGTHYYWRNNAGDIARTVAFRGGYQKIVDAMDQFVLASNEKTRLMAQEMRRAAEAKRKAIDLAAVPAAPPVDRAKQVELAHEVGMRACRYQYWFYVTQGNLKIDRSREQIDKEMDELKGSNTMLATALIRELQFPATSVEQLQQASSQSIFDELQKMDSNINRKAKGVGTDEDAVERCGKIVANVLTPLRP